MQPTAKGEARRLKQIREALDMSQSEFAEELGVAKNTVARWEWGDLIPPRLAELAAEYLLIKHRKKRQRRRDDK